MQQLLIAFYVLADATQLRERTPTRIHVNIRSGARHKFIGRLQKLVTVVLHQPRFIATLILNNDVVESRLHDVLTIKFFYFQLNGALLFVSFQLAQMLIRKRIAYLFFSVSANFGWTVQALG